MHTYSINMKSKQKILYEAPATTVVEVKTEGVICSSGNLRTLILLDGFTDSSGNPWSGTAGGSNAIGGWKDNGGSAWN